MLLNKFIMTLAVSGATLGLIGCCVSDDKCIKKDTAVMVVEQDKIPLSVEQETNLSPGQQLMLEKKVLYFSFDSYDLNATAKEIIATHALALLKNPSQYLTIIGHTDNLGGEKYNVALGMLRAEAVANILERNGVAKDRLNLISYGKTRPIAIGNSKLARSQNRRVELVYKDSNN